jgi:hypothetical protein
VYEAHKGKFIPLRELKWGEEMEYQIYVSDKATNTIKLSNSATQLIKEFNGSKLSQESEITLMPEFGGWMIEAVPSKPYESLMDPAELLSCEASLHSRRKVLDEFCSSHGL